MNNCSSPLAYPKETVILTIIKFLLFFISLIILFVSFYLGENIILYNIIQMCILLTLVFIELKMTKKVYSPLLFWYIFWYGAIIISRINVDFYDLRYVWGEELFIYVFLNTLVFFVVYHLVYFFRDILNSISIKQKRINRTLNHKKLYVLTKILLMLGIFAFAINSLVLKNIPMFTNNPNAYRGEFVTTKFFSIVNLTRIAIAFVPILLNSKLNMKKKKFIISAAIFYSLLNIATGWRGYFFQILILYVTSQFSVVVFNLNMKKKLVKYILISLVSIGLIGLMREGISLRSYGFSGLVEYTFRTIYLYIAPNFLNFQQALNTIKPNFSLMYTTEAIWGFFLNKEYFESYKNLSFAIGGFNVSTYLMYPYADFGLFGTLVWTSFISLISSTYYYLFQRTKKMYHMIIVGVFNIVIFTMHSNFFLRSSSILIWIIIGLFAYRKCYEKTSYTT